MESQILKGLNQAQRDAVVNYDSPSLIIAGAGSGKTRVLTSRIAYMIEQGVAPYNILALTFTNKAAEQMRERIAQMLPDGRHRYIRMGTFHSVFSRILRDNAERIGFPQSFTIYEPSDCKNLLKTIVKELNLDDTKYKPAMLASRISYAKNCLVTPGAYLANAGAAAEDRRMQIPEFGNIYNIYCARCKRNGAMDFDDLLLLTYRLLSEHPRIADFYRRLYRFVCVDEAQDLNEAQYSVLAALCGDSFRNIMMVGDPKQSIYGFNTSSPDYMWRFEEEFGAERIELTENFRSSRAVVALATALDPNYVVEGQLPIQGVVEAIPGADEEAEAKIVADKIRALMAEGHEDVEDLIVWESCAVLGRTRFALMAVESEFRERGIPFYKRLTANHENESDVMEDFVLSLRVMANPKDRLHLSALAKRWKTVIPAPSGEAEAVNAIGLMASSAGTPGAVAVASALAAIAARSQRLDMLPGLAVIRAHADTLEEDGKRAVYEDVAVFSEEWDQYLRTGPANKGVGGFMSSKALGATQQASREGVALLTVHSSKGLEFDVVFVVGMAEGVFPDYRAKTRREQEEESRNAFVAVTRSKRLLYLTWPRTRQMPWGDRRNQRPSRYLTSLRKG
mgnify:CR=1 FL=1